MEVTRRAFPREKIGKKRTSTQSPEQKVAEKEAKAAKRLVEHILKCRERMHGLAVLRG